MTSTAYIDPEEEPGYYSDGLSLALDMLRDHMAAEPDRDAYPADDGHAQAAYWAAYDEWASVGYGLRMMVGGMLIRETLDDL